MTAKKKALARINHTFSAAEMYRNATGAVHSIQAERAYGKLLDALAEAENLTMRGGLYEKGALMIALGETDRLLGLYRRMVRLGS